MVAQKALVVCLGRNEAYHLVFVDSLEAVGLVGLSVAVAVAVAPAYTPAGRLEAVAFENLWHSVEMLVPDSLGVLGIVEEQNLAVDFAAVLRHFAAGKLELDAQVVCVAVVEQSLAEEAVVGVVSLAVKAAGGSNVVVGTVERVELGFLP